MNGWALGQPFGPVYPEKLPCVRDIPGWVAVFQMERQIVLQWQGPRGVDQDEPQAALPFDRQLCHAWTDGMAHPLRVSVTTPASFLA